VSEIVWVTNPKNDTVDNLIAYLRAYAAEFFDSIAISCRMDFPSQAPPLPVKGEVRRDIFLVFKEALTNVAKHSGASEVDIGLQVDAKEGCALHIQVRDNGRGFNLDDTSAGNGLKNMRNRAEKRRGTLHVRSAPGTGTQVEIRIPLHAPTLNG
jgi:signal transduction histidine kinase